MCGTLSVPQTANHNLNREPQHHNRRTHHARKPLHPALKALFDAAFMETQPDKGGNLRVKERLSLHVRPREDRIRIFTVFGFKPATPMERRLEFVNRINKEFVIIRATAGDNDLLFFDYDIPVAGGITKKAVILLVKRFTGIPHAAIQEFGLDIVE